MRYRFEGCELDSDTLEFRSPAGPRRLEPQVFDLLLHLVRNPRRVVSRDELVERVWGGRIVSEATISSRIYAARKAIGDDGARQGLIVTVPRRGLRFLGEVQADPPVASSAGEAAAPAAAESRQTVRFCRSADGTRLAFGRSGSGPPLLRAGHWLTHLEHDWHSPIWLPFLQELGRSFTVVRYDQRGNGLSDRQVGLLSLEAFVEDLEAVAGAAELDRFALYATSQAVPVAVEYALRHPERLTHLVLQGGYAKGRLLRSPAEHAQAEAYLTLMEHGWGAAGSQYLQAFASIFIPDGTPEQIRSLVELQKLSATPDMAVRLRRTFDSFDVSGSLGRVAVPTLVIHTRDDAVHPLDQARDIAAAVPGAELLVLESRNHVVLEQDPVWPEFFEALRGFLGAPRAPA